MMVAAPKRDPRPADAREMATTRQRHKRGEGNWVPVYRAPFRERAELGLKPGDFELYLAIVHQWDNSNYKVNTSVRVSRETKGVYPEDPKTIKARLERLDEAGFILITRPAKRGRKAYVWPIEHMAHCGKEKDSALNSPAEGATTGGYPRNRNWENPPSDNGKNSNGKSDNFRTGSQSVFESGKYSLPPRDRGKDLTWDPLKEEEASKPRRSEHRPRTTTNESSALSLSAIAARYRTALALLDPENIEDYEELAAIREFDGGQPRDIAEREAYSEVVHQRIARLPTQEYRSRR